MTEHYTTNTESVLRWCNQCNRLTRHSVSGKRVGRCMEHQAAGASQRQQREAERRTREAANPRLF